MAIDSKKIPISAREKNFIEPPFPANGRNRKTDKMANLNLNILSLKYPDRQARRAAAQWRFNIINEDAVR
jgi:hypothetical protein